MSPFMIKNGDIFKNRGSCYLLSILVVQRITTSEGSGGTTHDERKEVKEHLLVASMKNKKRVLYSLFHRQRSHTLPPSIKRGVFTAKKDNILKWADSSKYPDKKKEKGELKAQPST
jgi:hypothetical protein